MASVAIGDRALEATGGAVKQPSVVSVLELTPSDFQATLLEAKPVPPSGGTDDTATSVTSFHPPLKKSRFRFGTRAR